MNINTHPFFEAELTLLLTLDVEGNKVEILAGHIDDLDLNLNSYGHRCFLSFSLFDREDVNALFAQTKVMKASLSFLPGKSLLEMTTPFEIQGIVTDKVFRRLRSPQGKETQTFYVYEISFSDSAKVTWEQHFPVNLYANESMKDIIDQHINPEVTIKYDWSLLEVKRPLTAFSLKYQPGIAAHQQTSFYSFLHWYLYQENGVLTYDYKTHEYDLSGEKKKAEGLPLELREWDVLPPTCIFPPSVRYNEKVLKHTSEALVAQDKENPDSFKSVRRDSIDSKNYPLFPEQAPEDVQSSLQLTKPEIDVEVIKFSDSIHIDKLVPGSFVSFTGDGEGEWSSDPNFASQKLRVRNLVFKAHNLNSSQEVELPYQSFQLYVKMKLEAEEEEFVERPTFNAPHFPFYMQGTVVSNVGEKEQSTHQILETEESPQGLYLIQVPLAGKGKTVMAPFVPSYSGQYYYPFNKGAKVLLGIHFHTTRIERPIDWDPLARLPKGVQGNQIVLASNGKDEYTILRNEYEEGKNSVFTIKKSSSETQVQTIQIQEKNVMVSVEEKDQKTLLLQLNNDSGFVLSLEDKASGNQQQIVFDGTSITTTCKGDAGTSVIIQKPDAISFDCKEFTIKSEKITFDAQDAIALNGANKVGIESKIADIAASTVNLGG